MSATGSEKPCVGLGMPVYGGVQFEAATAFYNATAGGCRVAGGYAKVSLLAQAHNEIWCNALRLFQAGKATHFACLHSDVELPTGWLDVMLAEMERVKADVLSLVLPIKDGRGLSSLARGYRERFRKTARITMRELARLPMTFDRLAAECEVLLVNTGCLVVDLRRHNWLATDERGFLRHYFTIDDAVRLDADGTLSTLVDPEDWHFSRDAALAGARVCATQVIHAHHLGGTKFPNYGAWGSVHHDGTEGVA